MLKRICFLMVWCCFANSGAKAQAANQEPGLKAVFIYNFTRYIEWDNLTEDNNFTIGIMGPSAIETYIEAIAKTNFVKNKKIVVKRFSSPEEINYCNILFVPREYPHPVKRVAGKTDKKVLLVSEKPGAAKEGASINFIVVNDKLKFEINQETMFAAGLRASSQLLKLAIIVD